MTSKQFDSFYKGVKNLSPTVEEHIKKRTKANLAVLTTCAFQREILDDDHRLRIATTRAELSVPWYLARQKYREAMKKAIDKMGPFIIPPVPTVKPIPNLQEIIRSTTTK